MMMSWENYNLTGRINCKESALGSRSSLSALVHVKVPWIKLIPCIMVIITVMISGCVTTRPVLSPPDPYKQLQHNINVILSDSIFVSTHACFKVVSLENGKVLYDYDSKALMNPASNMKLITSAAALSVLDTGYQFKTSIFTDDITADGSVAHNIYLKGFGDPDLASSDIDSLASAVRDYGIKTVLNNIIVDDSFFDDTDWGDGWAWDDDSDPDAPSINALSVNKNCITINLSADSSTISFSLVPATDFVNVINKATIAFDSICTPLKIRRLFINNTNTVMIEGDILCFDRVIKKLSLRHPQCYAGALLKESLRHAGVSVRGDVAKGSVPDGMHEIARHTQPIEKVVFAMNKQSDNLSAENMLKVMGALKSNMPGSAKNGIVVEKIFLAGLGMDTTKFALADGSGVSRYNLLSADQVVQFLTAMKKQPRLFPLFYSSLPVAGIDGTLSDRMSGSPAANNLRAKTGTLNGASCLSGYVTTRDGEMLTFSMMMQNFIASASEYRLAQDKIGALLAGFTKTAASKKVPVK